MSQAEELLNGMTDAEPVATAAAVNTEPHIVVGTDKFITVPPELRKIAVQHEHNVKTVTFDCPRYWDGRDLMDMVICVNYKTPNNVIAPKEVENVTVDPNDSTLIHFDWTITKSVTQMNGTLSFLLCGVKTDDAGMEEQHWNSELNREMTVSEGLECAQSILEEHPDVITDILARLRKLETGGGSSGGTTGNTTTTPSLLIVTLDENEQHASHSASEINAHINNGGCAVLEVGGPITMFAYPQYRIAGADYIPRVTFVLTQVGASVSQTVYGIGDDKSCIIVTESPNYGKDTSEGEVSLVDLSNFDNGSFTETVDGEVITHTTAFDDQGRLIAIDGAEIKWGSSE